MLRFGKPVKLLLVNRFLEDGLLPRVARPSNRYITVTNLSCIFVKSFKLILSDDGAYIT